MEQTQFFQWPLYDIITGFTMENVKIINGKAYRLSNDYLSRDRKYQRDYHKKRYLTKKAAANEKETR